MPDIASLHVTNIRQEKSLEPDGRGGVHDVWTIYFTSPSGTDAYVRVPADMYSAANVAQYIADELQHIEGVHALDQQPLVPPDTSQPTVEG